MPGAGLHSQNRLAPTLTLNAIGLALLAGQGPADVLKLWRTDIRDGAL